MKTHWKHSVFLALILTYSFDLVPVKAQENGTATRGRINGALEATSTHRAARRVKSCTVLHAAGEGFVLGASNEDWSDSATRFWIIPAMNGRRGWIKFGFAGGFPQGGMNDRGLFWDATGSPFLEMPYSETNKIHYDGPLMEKVITEAGFVEEARGILENYYCEDQYRAQYLVGDSTGASMIVEGDSIIDKNGGFQVLTNFYQSRPELGGHPCWRYDRVKTLLSTAGKITPGLIREVLDATHQEGRYPTQYSVIYDLRSLVVYLFHKYNFEEYVEIRLEDELRKGARFHDIAPLFSQVRLVRPEQDAVISGSSTEFTWTGRLSSEYELCYSTGQDATDSCTSVYSAIKPAKAHQSANTGVIVLLMGIFAWRCRRRQPVVIAALVLVLCTVFASCHDSITGLVPENVGDIRYVVDDLKNGETYYWKVVARAAAETGFSSESVARKFRTDE